jgi:hypothetical protein
VSGFVGEAGKWDGASKGGNTNFAEKPELILLKTTSFFSDLLGKNSGLQEITL